jgi:hypothetical protein
MGNVNPCAGLNDFNRNDFNEEESSEQEQNDSAVTKVVPGIWTTTIEFPGTPTACHESTLEIRFEEQNKLSSGDGQDC